jgi:crotonobetainyl-CoA:carnitine CoA-transferase CaiB-like acyl-CoA transferase
MALTRAHRGYDFGGIFPCIDGYVTVRPNEDRHWVGLAHGIDRPELAADPRFAKRKGRQDNADDLNAILQDFFSRHTMAAIYELLGGSGTPVGYFADAAAMKASPQFQAREWFCPVQVNGRAVDMPRAAFRMSLTPPLEPMQAPRLGEHNADVYAGIGVGADRLAILREAGIV